MRTPSYRGFSICICQSYVLREVKNAPTLMYDITCRPILKLHGLGGDSPSSSGPCVIIISHIQKPNTPVQHMLNVQQNSSHLVNIVDSSQIYGEAHYLAV